MRITSTLGPPPDDAVPTPSPTPIRRGARGEPVRSAQNQLLRAGFTLPKYGADGQFGRETAGAVLRFQQAHQLPATGQLDGATLLALLATPSPAPEYAALFADGVLRGVLAVGYDEVGAHEPEQAAVLRGLAERGFVHVDDAQRASLGLDADGRYVVRELALGDRTVQVVLELITPDTEDAKARFATALRTTELVLYGGHGRYGSGPDFDDIHSPAGNFVIGAPYEPGHVTVGPNDLDAARLTSDYQLMFFDGCSTFRYFDDLRSRTPGKSSKNLDVIGSTTELYWGATAANLLSVLDGVSAQANLAELEASLDQINRQGPDDQRHFFRGDGFEDNVRHR